MPSSKLAAGGLGEADARRVAPLAAGKLMTGAANGSSAPRSCCFASLRDQRRVQALPTGDAPLPCL